MNVTETSSLHQQVFSAKGPYLLSALLRKRPADIGRDCITHECHGNSYVFEWVISHIQIRHVTLEKKSCHTLHMNTAQIPSHLNMAEIVSHMNVTETPMFLNESYRTYRSLKKRHVTPTKESCHTHGWIMQETCMQIVKSQLEEEREGDMGRQRLGCSLYL